jgi:transcriptional regulator with XRE-family HTH domain
MSQSQVAGAANVCRSVVSQIERGGLEETSLLIIRRVASVLGISLPFEPHWRGSDLARLLDERHAALVRAIVERLTRLGWHSLVEHSFSEWGERGSIDVFAWHAGSRAVLVVEAKTRIVDLQNLLSTEDRKRRLAPILGRKLGWSPIVVGSIVVLPEETWARSAVRRYGAIFDAKFPMRTAEVRRWLKSPLGDMAGIWFLVNDAPGDPKRKSGGSMRVRPRRSSTEAADSRSAAQSGARPPTR